MTKARSLSDFIESDGSVTLVDNQKIKLGTSNDFEIYHVANSSTYLDASTGNVFIRNSSDDKDIILQTDDGSGGLANYIQADGSNGEVRLYHYGTEKLNTTSTGVDVTGGISIGGTEVINSSRNLTNITNLVVDNIDLGGNALTVASGNFTIDSAGYIEIDADTDGNIYLNDNTVGYGQLSGANGDFTISSAASDKDIIFKGNDGGSTITALTLDMSDAGSAYFNNNVAVAKSSLATWSSGYNALQVGGRGFVGAHSGSDLYVGQNASFNSGWKYEGSVAASLTQHSGGKITHFTAPAGTAGNAISWNSQMDITANAEVSLSHAGTKKFETTSTGTYTHHTGGNGLVFIGNSTNTAGTYTDLKFAYQLGDQSYGSGFRFKQVDTSHGGQIEFFTDNSSGVYTERMVLNETGILSFSGSANTEGIKLGSNHRIYGAGDGRAFEASSTTLQIGESYSNSTGIMMGGGNHSSIHKRIGSNEGSIFFQQGGGIGATTHGDTLPSMLMSSAYDNSSAEGLKFWVLTSASEWRPAVIYAIGATTQNVLTGQTAGWACIRCTHHNGGISVAIVDSGGGGSFAVNDLGGGSGGGDIEMQVTYGASGNNRTVVSGWCANYGTISGVVRA